MSRVAILLLGVVVVLAAALPAQGHERVGAPALDGVAAADVTMGTEVGASIASESLGVAADGAQATAALVLAAAFARALRGGLCQEPRRRRRVVTVLLVAVLAAMAFEIGQHGVHHLGDPQAAGQCVVAASADHVVAGDADVRSDVALHSVLGAAVVAAAVAPEANGDYGSDVGRAPPASAL